MDLKNDNDNYHASDLNKFADIYCKRNITFNNIDMITWDFNKKRLRIIETKHNKESMNPSQQKLLNFIAYIFKILNKIKPLNYTFEIYIARGDWPFKELTLYDIIKQDIYLLKTQLDIKLWLQFDKEL